MFKSVIIQKITSHALQNLDLSDFKKLTDPVKKQINQEQAGLLIL
jgi:hypothetical protein